jgi:hypothetical protein
MKVEIVKDGPVFNDTGFLCFSLEWIKGFGFSMDDRMDFRIWTFGFFVDTGFSVG